MTDISLSLVCALARNRAIGVDNRLPWRLPRDLAHFKAVTMGHPLIMGRKTFDSIGRPLPGRSNIVVTRQQNWARHGVTAVNTLADAIQYATDVAHVAGVNEIMLIGGASLYEQALPLARRLYLTEVLTEISGDAFFPEFSLSDWREIERKEFPADAQNPLACNFVIYESARL